MLQWPHRIVFPIGGIPVDLRYFHVFCLFFILRFFTHRIFPATVNLLSFLLFWYGHRIYLARSWYVLRKHYIVWRFYVSLFFLSDFELKPQRKLIVTVVKATNLKNKELIGKSDPYPTIHIHLYSSIKQRQSRTIWILSGIKHSNWL